MAKNKPKNDTAWEKLFEDRNILKDVRDNGTHAITSKEINKYREARLMTKFDHRVNLPKIFNDNQLAILPSTRGSYIIGQFQCYKNLDAQTKTAPIEIEYADEYESLSPNNLYSESVALLCAYQAGIIEDFVGDDKFHFTIFGRMSTGVFDYSIEVPTENGFTNQDLTVNRAQIEIDGGFESTQSFALFEVKNQEVQDFHIRQLYFPYRLWEERIDKKVLPIFTTYSNEIFSLSMYDFEELNNYSSIKLVKSKRYQLVPTDIELSDIRRILNESIVKPAPLNAPFPQADRIERVLDFLVQLKAAEAGRLTKEETTSNYAFTERQTQYYSGAALYLGLINREQNHQEGTLYSLTDLGHKIMEQTPKARNLALTEIILSRFVFREAMLSYLKESRLPTKEEIMSIMEKANLKLNNTTRYRRSQSVINWIQWIMELTVE